MVIPKRYPSLLTLIVFVATDLSHADTRNNIHIANGRSLSSTKDVFNPNGKITVEIINDFGGTVTLSYHCKSKNRWKPFHKFSQARFLRRFLNIQF